MQWKKPIIWLSNLLIIIITAILTSVYEFGASLEVALFQEKILSSPHVLLEFK